MSVPSSETQNVLAHLNSALREHAAPALAERVERICQSAAETLLDHIPQECSYCNMGSFYDADDRLNYVMDYWYMTREDFSDHRMRAVTDRRQVTHWLGHQLVKYNYETIEGRMKDWRGNDYYRGDRIFYLQKHSYGGPDIVEAIYDEPIYAEGQEPKIIAIWAIPVNASGRSVPDKRVRLTRLETITAVAA